MNRRLAILALAAPLAACGNTEPPATTPPPTLPPPVVTSARWEAPSRVADAGERPLRRCSPYTQSQCRHFYEQTAPVVAVNARGQTVAVWQRHEGADFRLMSARSTSGAGWSEEPVTPEAATSGTPIRSHQVVIDGGGNPLALWFGRAGAMTSRGLAAGGWSPAEEADASEQLVFDENGAAHTVFTRLNEGLFWTRLAPGGAWSEPVLLQAQGPVHPFVGDERIAVTRGGVVHALWVRRNQSRIAAEEWNEVWSSRMDPGRTWTPPSLLARYPQAHAMTPALAATDGGALAAYWVADAPPGDVRWRVVEQHAPAPAGGVAPAWTPPEPVSEPPTEPTRRTANQPVLASDGRDTLTLAWREVTYSPEESSRYEIRARRFSTAGGAWRHAQLVAAERGYLDDRFELHAAASAAGDAVLVWVEQRSFRLIVWASVFIPGYGWNAPQALREADQLSEPSVAMDGSGNAIVMWSEAEGDRATIWSVRLMASTVR